MPHRQNWLLENKVVYVVFSGELTSADIGSAFHISGDFIIKSTEAPVHFLHNWTDVQNFPKSITDVVKLAQNSKAPIRKVGWIVAYGKESRAFKFMGEIFFRAFNVKFKLFSTLDKALDFLAEQDGRLERDALLAAHPDHSSSV